MEVGKGSRCSERAVDARQGLGRCSDGSGFMLGEGLMRWEGV
jgi:hypothetical protein